MFIHEAVAAQSKSSRQLKLLQMVGDNRTETIFTGDFAKKRVNPALSGDSNSRKWLLISGSYDFHVSFTGSSGY
ncbi:MAG: hypothetical protein E5X00_00580 [Mesorhizobium sp.]|nr:MAG: hypothetical protein E5X96_09205 [Mesorhizobium sp.]TIP07216.1 MAG: hypothetical protein E5X92_17190 [Mesorhizobium sp.]TIS16134.1 MAG: hypothetical protein E5X09_00190 [Mesorhizobium sp.]TIS84663.1 MAG: hypothetical protein E5X00_00580 [Mesorhizobium sp.]